ncbi:MAG: pcrA-B, partial [Chlamydiales bacterium]|nr:pcrA-B [Chlamydiales bacterium]
NLNRGSEVLFPSVYGKYQRRLKEYNGVDFDDLLYLPLLLFKEHPGVLSNYQDLWHYLLIDEYQDTNTAQYQMVQHLIRQRGNLFAVGDPDQSIYSWRGADINNILHFEQDYPNARVIRLEENYRSTMTILEAANAVIQKNKKRLDKNLFSRMGQGELIQFHFAPNESKEAAFVARLVEKYRQRGISYQEMAIFYRTNSQSRGFEDRLLELGIPYRVIGGISFYQRKEIKDILAYLRVVENGADGIAFARTINLPKRGFGDSSLEKLIQAAQERQMSILECALRVLSGEPFSFRMAAKQKQGLDDYLNIIYDLRRKKESLSLGDFVRETIERTRYLEVLQEDPDTLEDRKQNLDELISKAFEWQLIHEGRPLSEFLEELTLQTTVEESGAEVDKVNLMTLHNGKGLEFDVAFISGLEEDLFPHVNSRSSLDGIEEERRLFYVGLTRAKKHLILSASSYRMFWGQFKPMRPSRFLAEIPKHLVEKRDGEVRPVYYEESRPATLLRESPPAAPAPGKLFKEGDIVFHQQFGIGKIIALEQGSMGLIYQVFFQKDNQERSLIASLAPLTRL